MKCPTCQKLVDWKDNPDRPFCSERCRMVDLGRWVNEEYSLPGDRISEEADTPAAAESPTHED